MPHVLFEHLIENNRFTTFPNVFIALRIYLTMPITAASGERSFSKLKLIKTYLRSIIAQERHKSLPLLSIECEIITIDFKVTVETGYNDTGYNDNSLLTTHFCWSRQNSYLLHAFDFGFSDTRYYDNSLLTTQVCSSPRTKLSYITTVIVFSLTH